jgi:uncharacterized protein YrrD
MVIGNDADDRLGDDQSVTHPDAATSAADSEEFRDRRVVDEHGDDLGKVTDVIYDAATNRPIWLVVDAGILHADHYMPVAGTYRSEEGNIVSPYDKETVHHATKASKQHVMTHETEHELYSYYGVKGEEA